MQQIESLLINNMQTKTTHYRVNFYDYCWDNLETPHSGAARLIKTAFFEDKKTANAFMRKLKKLELIKQYGYDWFLSSNRSIEVQTNF